MSKYQEEWKPEEWKREENPWYQQAARTAEALLDRPAFQYDPGADPLYQSAKSQYLRQGRRAMEDTLGRTAALSGGYASSYAQTQGTQAYDASLTRLAELLPDYYEKARAAYDKETGALRDSLSTALGLYDKDYQSWLDRQKTLERRADAEAQQHRWQQEFSESHRRWTDEFARDNSQWEAEFERDNSHWEAELAQEAERWAAQQAASQASQARSDAASERSYAYRMAMLALQRGLKVSDALLQSAGIDPAYAETIRRYFAAQH